MPRQPTIKDVAAVAAVSFKTVSRVLNGEPHVRPELRDRVVAAVDALGYRPNLAARSLPGASSGLIGFFYDNPNYDYVTDAESGIVRRCRESGRYATIEFIDSQSAVERQVKTILTNLKLDGVILTPPLSDNDIVLSLLEQYGVRYVRVAPYVERSRSPCVFIDDAQAAYAITCRLLRLGHRAIGFVKGHPNHGASAERLSGYRRAMAEQGAEIRQDHLAEGDFTFESGRRAGEALLMGARPTAIFAANDAMAIGVINSARALKLAIPHDLSVAGFDDVRASLMASPPLTTVRQPIAAMGYRATDLLLAMLKGEGDEATAVQMDFEIIDRGSSAPLAHV